MFFALLIGAAALQMQSEPTTLTEVLVEGRRINPLLTVAATGEATPTAIVRSDPVAIRCGLASYQYHEYAAPRLCWLRAPAGAAILLRAEQAEASGWSVEWRGCEPSADGKECALTMPPEGARVEVRFSNR